jgi:dolichol-phosphate mannosyltransferase
MNVSSQKFTLVIPTYNEADNIEGLLNLSIGELARNNVDFEIIVVDDNSHDQTWKIVQGISEKDKRIKLIRRIGERGLATAVVAGWKNATGDILGVIDGDLQQPPGAIPVLLNKLNEDASVGIVIASRNIKGAGLSRRSIWRRFVSGLGAYISTLLFPRILSRLSDPMSGFFILRKEVIKNKVLTPWGYKILLEVLVKGDYEKVAEAPYVFVERKKGSSKAGIGQYLISFIYLLRLSLQSKAGLKSLR